MSTHRLSLAEAAAVLGLPVSGVEALIVAGYLTAEAKVGTAVPDGEQTLALSEVKSFQARNSHGGASASDLLSDIDGLESGADAILDALGGAVDVMADKTADILTGVFPEVADWTPDRRQSFVDQAARRFESILEVTRRSEQLDDDVFGDLFTDLADAGGAAAFAGAPLPQVLLTLRISRDLMVQTAVTAAEERGRHWGVALAVVLTRVLPVLDRLLDSVARGYWEAVLLREQEAFARFEHVVEHSESGVYEADLDGRLTYTNPAMAAICGADQDDLADRTLTELLVPLGSDLDPEVFHTPTVLGPTELQVCRADGVERVLSVVVTERRDDGIVVGFDGVVRDVTAERELEQQKNDFLARVTEELRQPLTTILGLGVTLDTHGEVLPPPRVKRIGRTIHIQAERIARLADDLYDISRLEAQDLTLSRQELDTATTVEAGLAMLPDTRDVVVDVADDLVVIGDPRRLQQVMAHLAQNAIVHGAAPVHITAAAVADRIEITVADAGTGVPPEVAAGLFRHLHPTRGTDRLRNRASGLGLPLARGLVEAMGGRLRYASPLGEGARFIVSLPRRD